MRTGPSKPVTTVKEAAGFLKQLSKSSARHFPTTSERLMEIVRLLGAMRFQRRSDVSTLDSTLCSHPGSCVDNFNKNGGYYCANSGVLSRRFAARRNRNTDVSTDGLVELIAYLRSFNDFKLQMVADALEALKRSNAEMREAADRGLQYAIEDANSGKNSPQVFENIMKDIRFIEQALSHSSELPE